MKIVAISGSLRARSSNTELLRASMQLAPAGVEVEIYGGIGELPHFNPDVEESGPPPIVAELRQLLGRAEAVLISSPEYAHGVPGTMKNALDWLVGAGELVGKPVAVINASSNAKHAYASLIETLTVMSWRVVHEACITVQLAGKKLDANGIASDEEIGGAVRAALKALIGEADLSSRA